MTLPFEPSDGRTLGRMSSRLDETELTSTSPPCPCTFRPHPRLRLVSSGFATMHPNNAITINAVEAYDIADFDASVRPSFCPPFPVSALWSRSTYPRACADSRRSYYPPHRSCDSSCPRPVSARTILPSLPPVSPAALHLSPAPPIPAASYRRDAPHRLSSRRSTPPRESSETRRRLLRPRLRLRSRLTFSPSSRLDLRLKGVEGDDGPRMEGVEL
jgi:hypothetical protein